MSKVKFTLCISETLEKEFMAAAKACEKSCEQLLHDFIHDYIREHKAAEEHKARLRKQIQIDMEA